MVSTNKILGVATATSAKAVAGVATSAKMTGAVKKFTALTAMALVAFSLSACGNGESVSRPSVEKPLVSKDLTSKGNLVLKIQSQDNETIIQDVSINRGNCAVEKYVLDKQKLKLYARENPDRCHSGNILRNKKGERLNLEGVCGLAGYSSTHTTIFWLLDSKKDMEWYDNLNDKSKAVYVPVFPKNLKFGQTHNIRTNCAVENIIEVSLTVNGSKIVYNF